ncbi:MULTISPECIES: regulatory protein RecX [unclassified Novosphingobium]|uniref:regulatory protein RecX n=1 Tax=unclassified Novosphingobium TaxID=2644732 RepID=UPI00135C73D8|nr:MULTISPECIES: RecX family transcriptional regulator [unclassified Novosphingobium]
MSDKRRNEGRKGPPPLNQTRLEELALAYVARFATTQAKLRLYLQRKTRERGWDGDSEDGRDGERSGAGEASGALEELVGRYAEKGYVDDAAWAKMKAGSLLRRGYGARRVGEALGQAGVNEDLRAEQRPGLGEQRRAALVLARRRRFGPFAVQCGESEVDPKLHDKQLAAMLRAGHPLDIARRIVESDDADALEEWGESEFGDD